MTQKEKFGEEDLYTNKEGKLPKIVPENT